MKFLLNYFRKFYAMINIEYCYWIRLQFDVGMNKSQFYLMNLLNETIYSYIKISKKYQVQGRSEFSLFDYCTWYMYTSIKKWIGLVQAWISSENVNFWTFNRFFNRTFIDFQFFRKLRLKTQNDLNHLHF
jgi:hypothetical protein